MSGTPNESEDKWTLGIRLLHGQVPRASVRGTLTYKFHPRLTAGVEYNPRVGEVAPIANFLAVTETARRPALMFGTSSDRIGTPSGQSFYGILSKNLKRQTGLPVAPYAGLAYGTYEDRLRPVGEGRTSRPGEASSPLPHRCRRRERRSGVRRGTRRRREVCR